MKVARKIEFEAILISNKSKSFQVPLLTVWVWCPFYVWFLGLFEQEPLFGLGLGVIQKRFHLKIKISKGFSVLLIHGIYVISLLLGYPMPPLPSPWSDVIYWWPLKGQLISKAIYGVLDSPKMNEKDLTWCIIVVSSQFFFIFSFIFWRS